MKDSDLNNNPFTFVLCLKSTGEEVNKSLRLKAVNVLLKFLG